MRKACNEAVAGFMKQLGYEAMRKAADKLSAVSKTTLMPLLGKHRTFITVRMVFRAFKGTVSQNGFGFL